jgi:hypothetical protein
LKWISCECSDEGSYNSTRSHPSEEENRTRNHSKNRKSVNGSLKARLHDAIFAYDCSVQLADAIPATLCHLFRRYDYCMRLFQPRDILDPLSTFFLLCLGHTLNRRRTNFAFSHLIVDHVRHFDLFFHKKCMKVAGF